MFISKKKKTRFGETLEALLKEAKLTKYKLAQLSGVSEATISKYTYGDREPKYDSIVRLAEHLPGNALKQLLEAANYVFPENILLDEKGKDLISDQENSKLVAQILKRISEIHQEQLDPDVVLNALDIALEMYRKMNKGTQ